MAIKSKYYILRRHEKENTICKVLNNAGYSNTNEKSKSSFALTHMDTNIWKKKLLNYTKPIFMYPHALDSWQNYDWGAKPWRRISCNFISGQRVKDILEFLNYPCRIEMVGFPFLRKVSPLSISTGNKILFSPIHTINGEMDDDRKLVNLRVLESLKTLLPEWDITVYPHWSLEASGLYGIPGINYVFSDLSVSNAIQMISANDIVIAEGTFLNLAVALGKPTISFNTRPPIHANGLPELKLWHPELMELWRYPIDIFDYADPRYALEDCNNSDTISTWKQDVLGGSFNASKFINVIKEYIS